MTMQITVNANQLVSELWPRLRSRLQSVAPFLDDNFGNHLADQAIRHDVHRVTTYRSQGTYKGTLSREEAPFLCQQMRHVGFNYILTSGYIDVLDTAQCLALEEIEGYEIRNGARITGQTP